MDSSNLRDITQIKSEILDLLLAHTRVSAIFDVSDKFWEWSGSAHSNNHHYGDHGLAQHTLEVMVFSHQAALLARHIHGRNSVDIDVLMTAAFFHDYGKIRDYEKTPEGVWRGTQHKRDIHHISRSAIQWNLIAENTGLESDFIDKVTHCILSHHGMREWGSPVAPRTREAWILHLSDNMSARMDDCDIRDPFAIKPH